MNTLIKIRNLSVDYDTHRVLHDVDLDIYDDDFVGVIGPNGGGKTTLVKSILGAVPYRGTIEFAPELYAGTRRLIGYMPQQSNFDRAFPISVRDRSCSAGAYSLSGGAYRHKVRERIRSCRDTAPHRESPSRAWSYRRHWDR